MKITNKFLNDNKTENGAWTKAQLKSIGVDWPPQKGWKKKILGSEISEETSIFFVAIKNILAKPNRKDN